MPLSTVNENDREGFGKVSTPAPAPGGVSSPPKESGPSQVRFSEPGAADGRNDGAKKRLDNVPQFGKGSVFAMDSSYGPRLYSRADQSEFVQEDDHGFLGIVARNMNIPKGAWDAHQEWNRRQILKAYGGRRPPRRSILGVPVVSPYAYACLFWSAFMLIVDFTYTAFWVPLGVAFCTDSFGDINSGCTSADLVGGIIYTINLIFGFVSGIVITHDYKKLEVLDGRRVAMYYIRYGRFWLDLLATIPFVYLVVLLCAGIQGGGSSSWVSVLSLVRLVRLLRLISISKVVMVDALSGKYHDLGSRYMSVTTKYTITLGYVLAVIINLEACILVLVAYLEGVENSWLSSVGWDDFVHADKPYQWYCAIYWVVTTSTTTGYGDFTPRSVAEQVFANIYMIMGMLMFGLLVGTIANALTRASNSAHQMYRFRRKISMVAQWLQDHHIPEHTRKQVQTYFSEVWVDKAEASLDTEIFNDLPAYLRVKVAQYITTDLVLQMHVLKDQEAGLQELIAQHLRPSDITPGHDVCRQGEEGDRLYIIQEGDVVAMQHQTEPCHLPIPCMVGESIILADDMPSFRVRPWTVRTLGLVKMWELRLTDLWPIIRMYPRLKEDLLEYIRGQLLAEVGFIMTAMSSGNAWCEGVASISSALLKQSQAVVDQAVAELQQAKIEDNSLQMLLDGLLEFSTVKTKRLTLVQTPGSLAHASPSMPVPASASAGLGTHSAGGGSPFAQAGAAAAAAAGSGGAQPDRALSLHHQHSSHGGALGGGGPSGGGTWGPGGLYHVGSTNSMRGDDGNAGDRSHHESHHGPAGGAVGSSSRSGPLQRLSGPLHSAQGPIITHPCPTCGRHVCTSCGQVVTHQGVGGGGQLGAGAQPLPLPGATPGLMLLPAPAAGSNGNLAAAGGAAGAAAGATPVYYSNGLVTTAGSGSALLASIRAQNQGVPRPQWRPTQRFNTFSRMSTMGHRLGNSSHDLLATSIPVENFGQGYGMWG